MDINNLSNKVKEKIKERINKDYTKVFLPVIYELPPIKDLEDLMRLDRTYFELHPEHEAYIRPFHDMDVEDNFGVKSNFTLVINVFGFMRVRQYIDKIITTN